MNRTVTVATLFPLATVAAGDEANGSALVRRAAARGVALEVVTVNRPDAFVAADLYLLGGTGRGGVPDLVRALGRTDLAARVAGGDATVLAVDAGLDAVSEEWVTPTGQPQPGLGLVPVVVGPATPVTDTVVTRPDPALGLPALIGWESNDVRTSRDGVRPLVELEHGSGDRGDTPADGVLTDRVIGTRLHGPVLALNPELADLVLARALGRTEPWEPLPPGAVERARAERIVERRAAAAGRRSPARFAARLGLARSR